MFGRLAASRIGSQLIPYRMKLAIHASLDYRFDDAIDLLLQIEAAAIPEQRIDAAHIDISEHEYFARVAAQDMIGERIWLRASKRLRVDYRATVTVDRILRDCSDLEVMQPHRLPGEAVQYLLPSRYCASDRFKTFVDSEFGGIEGGAKVIAMRDWIHDHLSYVPGSSTAETTALDTFVRRQGICRDYAHLMITFVRAANIPARIASVYALGVKPPDFHAVAEVFLGGEWHLIDPTGMAKEGGMAKIGVGRDAADVAFLTAYGVAEMNSQSVTVEAV